MKGGSTKSFRMRSGTRHGHNPAWKQGKTPISARNQRRLAKKQAAKEKPDEV
jgi:hypothetical protein